jgi:hypothetical protein
MKKENLVVGKWYKVKNYSELYYKFDCHIDNSSIKMTQYKKLKEEGNEIVLNHPASNSDFWLNAVEATIEELKTFLPPNHPDLITERTYELW